MSQATDGFVMNQTMLRIKDPQKSVQFYTDVLGMTLLDRYNFGLAFIKDPDGYWIEILSARGLSSLINSIQ